MAETSVLFCGMHDRLSFISHCRTQEYIRPDSISNRHAAAAVFSISSMQNLLLFSLKRKFCTAWSQNPDQCNFLIPPLKSMYLEDSCFKKLLLHLFPLQVCCRHYNVVFNLTYTFTMHIGLTELDELGQMLSLILFFV